MYNILHVGLVLTTNYIKYAIFTYITNNLTALKNGHCTDCTDTLILMNVKELYVFLSCTHEQKDILIYIYQSLLP